MLRPLSGSLLAGRKSFEVQFSWAIENRTRDVRMLPGMRLNLREIANACFEAGQSWKRALACYRRVRI